MPASPEERPEDVKDFTVLYKQNCAACHGEQGHGGIAVSLANPTYIAIAGKDAIAKATREGGPGALMPPFGRKYGGFLTDEQVEILANGIVCEWGRGSVANAPAYAATSSGDPAAGKIAFDRDCARCHVANAATQKTNAKFVGSVTDPDFLALISNQNLRTTILAGKPDEGMPDWRGFAAQPLNDSEVTNIVAWLAAERRSDAPQKTAGYKQGVQP
jgi:cytochrome c oxidase cbb3-type subunit 3/ubiquinol-cytochrome c reductase cytochrome c subunit